MVKFIEITSSSIKWIIRYSGLEFIYRKFYPSKNPQQLPTGFIWLIGIYVAFFGVASQRYENRIDIIENRANSIFAQLATNAYKKALGRISKVQDMWCPEKPDILNPISVFSSLFIEDKYPEMVKLLIETIEDWKEKLDGVNLHNANLRGADLRKANLGGADLGGADLRDAKLIEADLRKTDLRKADLRGADLYQAKLRGANLYEADLREAELEEANLYGADLREANLSEAELYDADLSFAGLIGADLNGAGLKGADLRGTHLDGADLRGADLSEANLSAAKELTFEQLCEASTLYGAIFDQELARQMKQKCPDLLKKEKRD